MKNNNKTIVFKIDDSLKDQLIKFYKDQMRDKVPPHAVFQAKVYDGTIITLYESGKIMFQGIGADIESMIWKEKQRLIDKETNPNYYLENAIKRESTIGSDEVGTGDYFGPIIVASTYVNKENIPFLYKLNIRDSKKITDSRILKVAPQIMEKIPYEYEIITPEMFNKCTDNLNKIKAKAHNNVLNKLKKHNLEYKYIVVDQFCMPNTYFRYLTKEEDVCKGITFLTKAESKCYSVAAASVIARYLFINEIDKMSKTLGKKVPKGAGKEVTTFAKDLANEIGFDNLNKYVKLSFKNTNEIK